jgi:hypothetical protein
MDYTEFLGAKTDYGTDTGFEPLWMPDFLFGFQKHLTDWAIRKGRAAIFADCGMGKTPMQLVWADNVVRKTNRPVLILTPLAVSGQTLDEAEKFDIEATRAHPDKNPTMIQVTNYEQLHKYDSANYAGVVCDESSILKNFDGKRKSEITEFMRRAEYRLLCTATAAPNDWIELGTSSEALGYLGHMDMLTRFFTNKQQSAALMRGRFTRDKWRLKMHAEDAFWRWVASWARAARKPSDLGFDDNGFILPPLHETRTEIQAIAPTQGMLFDMPAVSFHEEREAIRRTIQERCEAAAEKVSQNGNISMVWCHLNDEGDTLEKLIPGAVQIAGSHSDERKEEAARWFVHGTDERRVLISKPRIFGFGLNFQHCNHMTYFPTHSYEQYYQATRRLWRFGQENPVTVHLIYTNGGSRMMKSLHEKAKQADQMFRDMIANMGQELFLERTYTKRRVEVPAWMS